ncbi:hypothetical protein N7471_002992 [Penicillium samsonianum]|uniref:uncharacterized protein n=1 Tax=Penicillium samsonianum TaxID=1882272 RepID=UPI0025485B35|nr:uncharacterized protein N7471_002992 [Penicillium samsonianum]KAJ6143539.1 hypothetical protein N7471_002992 [Penicillium samsonianum]
MPSSDEQPDNLSLLLEAINNQSIPHLEGILRDIVKHSPEGRKIASRWLLAAKNDVKSEPVPPVSPTAPVTSALRTKEEPISKPMTSVPMTFRFKNCIYCLEDFEVTQNSETSCKYHVEPDMVDEEYFKDEIAAGIDVHNDEYREAWPDGFFYPCCGMNLTEEMCQVGWHKAADPDDRPRKRTRSE